MADLEERLGRCKEGLDELFHGVDHFDLSVFDDLLADLEATMDEATETGGWRDFDSSLDETDRDLQQIMAKVQALREVDEELHFHPPPPTIPPTRRKQTADGASSSTEGDSQGPPPSAIDRELGEIEARYLGSRVKALLPTRP
jgi:hypothetical protein